MRLTTTAPAKINVCLFLGPVREDGRHEIVSVMQSISLADRVVLSQLPDGEPDEIAGSGAAIENNLALAAVALLRKRGNQKIAPARVEIDKRIPVAAGLAGGSSDAAATLRLLARAHDIDDAELLHGVASELGADVPAQLRPGRTLATGAGEVVERIPGVAAYTLLVVPDIEGLSTADVYAESDRLGLPRPAETLAQALESVRGALPDLPDELCVNELAPAALSLRPHLEGRLRKLREAGADIALVSGSGPTTLGLFRDGDAARAAAPGFKGAIVAKTVGSHAGEVLAA
jgi:4-diphosphocytidyl-2-C-methyl-D-erythritol kinase